MSDSTVIREFLVRLGFKTDEKSLKNFSDGIEGATKSVVKLVAAIEAAALTVGAGVAAFASNLESLYFASMKTGASVTNIKAFENAARNLGVTAGESEQSIQALARWMRNNPGSESIIKSLGVDSRDVNGNLRDTVDIMTDLGRAMANKPYFLAMDWSKDLGIGEDTMRAMMNGDFARELERQRALLKDAGFDEAAAKAHNFAEKLRGLQARVQAVGVTIGTALIDALGPQMDDAARWFDKNAVQIANAVTTVGKVIIAAGGWITPVLGKVADGWKNIYEWTKAAGEALVKFMPSSWSDKIGEWTGNLFDALGIRGKVDDALDLSRPAQDKAAQLTALEKKYGLPAGLLDSVWAAESGRGKNIRSRAGAKGPFQFMDDTSKQYGLSNPDDFNQASDAAARYYRDLLGRYGGNLEKAVAAYNWGPGNIDRNGLSAAPLETRQYIDRVKSGMGTGAPPQLNQTTNITVNGGDAISTGQAVAGEQDRVNARFVRNSVALVR